MPQLSSPVTTDGRPQRLYVYKLTTDDGGAPCTDDTELLSLAICKPFIRTTAAEGDLVFGFAGKTLDPDNRLIYIACVTRVLSDGEYYESPAHHQRSDCIYLRGKDGAFHVRSNARFHKDGGQLTHDLGSAYEYRRATVLVSDDFRYFGGEQVADLGAYREIREMLRTLRQGHRVYHPPGRERELRNLYEWAWRRFPSDKVIGSPSQLHHGLARDGCAPECH